MNNKATEARFDDVKNVIEHPVLFKRMLSIGEDAYATLRLKNKVVEAWDVVGMGGTAATVAKSSAIASTFFSPSGFLSFLGIGAATTPVGWVVAAGIIGGGACWGITQFMKSTPICRVDKIPEFINTPLDVLALALFDLLAPLSLKVARIDGSIDESERSLIAAYFVNEWGYDKLFITEGLCFIESKLSELDVEELAITLAIFTAENPDCNYKSMSENIVKFLNDIVDSDGIRAEAEVSGVEQIQSVFNDHDPSRLKNKATHLRKSVNSNVNKIKSLAVTKLKRSKKNT